MIDQLDVYVNGRHAAHMKREIRLMFEPDASHVPADARFTITELAEQFGITTRTIRYYEDEGMISPERQGQNRIYCKRDYARLRWILRGKRTGFSLSEIREMLDLYDLGDGRERQREVTLSHCRAKLQALKEQRADIDFLIEELEHFCVMLNHKVNSRQPVG